MTNADSSSRGFKTECNVRQSEQSRAELPDEDPTDADFTQRLAAYDEALAAGSAGSGREPDASSAGEASLAAELEEAKECLRLLEKVWPRAAFGRCVTDATAATDGSDSGDALTGQPKASGAEGRDRTATFGRFQIVRELGRGGGGIVFLAQDPKLGRLVALKVPQPEFVFTPSLRRRFLREAHAASTLDHPHIVPVHGAGQEGPICYIAFAYCPGTTLAGWLSRRRQPVDGSSAARLVAMLADAVDYAHRQGVLHRDLKPGNVLLELPEHIAKQAPPGEQPESFLSLELQDYVPKLTDFGLAKLLAREENETRSGAVLGSVAYMAPEQAEGRVHDVGPATDVYALGVILYQLLVGHPPFRGASDLQTLSQVATDAPRTVRSQQRRVSRDLEAICLKCLEKQTARRYGTASELAEDLQRFLTGIPTQAKPATWPQTASKWTRRRPVASALIMVSLLSTALLAIGLAWHLASLRRAQEFTAAIAQESRQRSERHKYASYIQGAHQAWQNGDVASARDLLARCRPPAGHDDPRGFEWYYLQRLCDGCMRSLAGHQGRVQCADFSPSGDVLATCADDGSIHLWDPHTGLAIAALDSDGIGLHAIRFSQDRRWLASAGEDGQVTLRDGSTYQVLATFGGGAGAVYDLVFSPDGNTLATAVADGGVEVWEVSSRHRRLTLRGHHEAAHAVAFSPDGNLLVSGSVDQTIQVWDLRSPHEPIKTIRDVGPVFAVAISPDGRTLAAAGLLRLWDLVGDGEPRLLAGHRNHVRSIAFSANGETLVSAGDDMTLRTWDVATGTLQHTYHGHTGPIHEAAYLPQENLVATAGADGMVGVWDITAPQDRRPLPVPSRGTERVAFSPNGQTLVTSNGEAEARIWHIADGVELGVFRYPKGPNHSYFSALAISPDGRCVALGCHPGSVLLWYPGLEADVRTLDDVSSLNNACMFSPDGRRLAVAGFESASVRVYDLTAGTQLAKLPGQRCVAFSPDGRLIAMESSLSVFAVELWDWMSHRRVAVLPGHVGEIYRVVFSKDGHLLATASQDGTARIWDVTGKTERFTLRAHTEAVYDVSFSPRGRSLATAGVDGTVKFWDLETGRLLLSLVVGTGDVTPLAFLPDGPFLATVLNQPNGGIRVDLWDAREHEAFVAK